MIRHRRLVMVGLLLGMQAVPALAHHRQTPEVQVLVPTGDVTLSRLPSQGRSTTGFLLPQEGGGSQVATISPYKDPTLLTPVGVPGDNQNLAVSWTGTMLAWDTDDDPLGGGSPGRQIIMARRGQLVQATNDPTGTASNPTLDVAGLRMAFESAGDFAGTNPTGARQIFLLDSSGFIKQLSVGAGTSRNPVLSVHKGLIAFESTSDPVTGADTGVFQIWLGSIDGSMPPAPITNGLVSSGKPTFSDDGALVAFESRADLPRDRTDMGRTQIFIYHIKTQTSAQLTFDDAGCTDPATARVKRDWRITYVCNGTGYYYMLRADDQYALPIVGGNTTRVLPELGIHFLVVATTADLVNGGETPEHHVYQLNLYKRDGVPVDTGHVAFWFPRRGLPPLL